MQTDIIGLISKKSQGYFKARLFKAYIGVTIHKEEKSYHQGSVRRGMATVRGFGGRVS